MMKYGHYLCGVVAAFFVTTSSVTAEPTADYMVQEATGLLHHSCDSIVDATDADEAEITEVVRKMVAVSLVNRQVDWNEYANTADEAAELRANFVAALRAGCEADRKALLAGVVDDAVKEVFGL